MLKSFSLKDMREKMFKGIQIGHIYQPNKSTLVNNLGPHEKYQLHAKMDHNHMLTFEI